MCEKGSQPLFNLTVEEFENLSRNLFAAEAKRLLEKQDKTKQQKALPDIIFVDEIINLTGYKKSTIYSKVSRYEMPVLSRRKPLTFSREAILSWIQNGKPNLVEEEANHFLRVHKNVS